jgi:copper chaperone
MEGFQMEKTVFNVEGMSCNHCKMSVTNAVGELPGVSNVIVDLEAKTATVGYDPVVCAPDAIKAEIETLGFDVVG